MKYVVQWYQKYMLNKTCITINLTSRLGLQEVNHIVTAYGFHITSTMFALVSYMSKKLYNQLLIWCRRESVMFWMLSSSASAWWRLWMKRVMKSTLRPWLMPCLYQYEYTRLTAVALLKLLPLTMSQKPANHANHLFISCIDLGTMMCCIQDIDLNACSVIIHQWNTDFDISQLDSVAMLLIFVRIVATADHPANVEGIQWQLLIFPRWMSNLEICGIFHGRDCRGYLKLQWELMYDWIHWQFL